MTDTVHAEGTVFLQVILNDITMATHPLVYYSLTANIVTGLSQIYLEQLSSLITAVITDDTSSTDDVNLILPDTLPQPERVGLVVASEPVWNASHIDALMTKFFVEESIEKIPAQAFEELFGVYSRVNTGKSINSGNASRMFGNKCYKQTFKGRSKLIIFTIVYTV